MDNTMISIAKYITNNLALFGLTQASDLKLIEHSNTPLPNGAKYLVMLPLRTYPGNTDQAPFGTIKATSQKVERFRTRLEFECKTRAPDPSKDFYWNTARQFRDKVYNALAGPDKTGIVIPRYDWTDPQKPVPAGEIWFQIDPASNTPVQDEIEDPNDKANKSIFLTFDVHWWKPTGEQPTEQVDPWLEALAQWTETELGPGWAVVRNAYPNVYQRPAVKWSVGNITARQVSNAMFEVTKSFTAKVMGAIPNQQTAGCLKLVEGLGRDIKIPLDVANNKYMTVINPAANIPADSLYEGQVTVTLTRKTTRPTEEVPLMAKVNIEGSLL